MRLFLEFVLGKGTNIGGVGHQGGNRCLLIVSGKEMLVGTGSEDANILGTVSLRAERNCSLELELRLGGIHIGEINATLLVVGVRISRPIGIGQNGEGLLIGGQIGSQREYILTTILWR